MRLNPLSATPEEFQSWLATLCAFVPEALDIDCDACDESGRPVLTLSHGDENLSLCSECMAAMTHHLGNVRDKLDPDWYKDQ